MKVQKFGGSSLVSLERVETMVSIVQQGAKEGTVIVVISALEGITDLLLKAGRFAESQDSDYHQVLASVEQTLLNYTRSLLPITTQSATLSMAKQYINQLEDICHGIFTLRELSPRTLDFLLSFGELITSKIISAHFTALQLDHEWIDSREIIRTDDQYGHAEVDFEQTNALIQRKWENFKLPIAIVPGYFGSDDAGHPTTLGRGGSDYTASVIAAALQADALEIWTDVNGMMTADPREVKNARSVSSISYQEAMELSHFGAKVLYPPAVQPVMGKHIPIYIKNTLSPSDQGTLISDAYDDSSDHVRGISSNHNIAMLSLEGTLLVGIPGFAQRLFSALASQGINVVFITQNSSEYSLCLGIKEEDHTPALQAINNMFERELLDGSLIAVHSELDVAVIALVGNSMVRLPGISGRMFSALGGNGINVRAIAQGSSERNISAIIARKDLRKALNVLHEEFFETTYKQINLYLVGVGNVGKRLIAQVQHQVEHLRSQLKLQVRLIGIANSRTMALQEDGIDWENWQEALAQGSPMDLNSFAQEIFKLNKRNSVFVDITSSEAVAKIYPTLLKQNISVVACNKIACSSSLNEYQELKRSTRKYNAQFLYETNVGAGLPVINTLSDLMRSGDQVLRIEAVLSGTMNYIFNNYDTSTSFAHVVRQAQKEGYTEPDPRQDLNGMDVMRKILILARDSGRALEMSNVENVEFLPAGALEGDIEQFYQVLEANEAHFQAIYQEAQQKNCRLKFIASIEGDQAKVALQSVPAESNFYHLNGNDNAVLFYTNRYPQLPLTVKGAGAGAEVTAAGIFSDIIRAARSTF